MGSSRRWAFAVVISALGTGAVGCTAAEPRPASPPPLPEPERGAAPSIEFPKDDGKPTALHTRPRETIVIGANNRDLVWNEAPPAAEGNKGAALPPTSGRPVVQTNHYYGGYYPYGYGSSPTGQRPGEPGTSGGAQPSRPPTTVGGDWAAPKDPGPGMIKNWQAR